ncbi:MAG: cellulase family glycosylhydrolase [Actinomycetota bacterium]
MKRAHGGPPTSAPKPPRRTSRYRPVTATMIACLLIVPVAPAAADPPIPALMPAVGTHFHALWTSYSAAERIEVLDKLAAAGVDWVRIDIGWATIQEQGPDWYSDWYIDQADAVIDAAGERGINVLGLLWRTPSWANGGEGPSAPPDDPDDYGRIARWAAEHFRGRVAAWEVWNEPNQNAFWTGSARDVARLLRASYDDFKTGDPDAEVVMPAPAYNDVAWLRDVYAAGAQGFFDVMATHPYMAPSNLPPEMDTGTTWDISSVERVRALMEENGDGDKPIWFTEVGWSSHPNSGDEAPWELGVTKEQQADFLARAVRFVACRFPYVEQIFWYSERDLGAPHGAGPDQIQLGNYGLLAEDLDPKPAYEAMSEIASGPGITFCPGITVQGP